MDSARNWKIKSMMMVAMIIIVDQLSKVTVLKTMYRGQSISVFGDWLKLTFIENPGMAFGIQFGPPALITIFSIVATILIIVYLYRVGGMFRPYRISLSMVLGGAIGNIIDRVFYGKILHDDPYFLGKVVDFIHINVWRGMVPEAIPFLGGKYLALFPIWNVADMAIVLGVVGIISYQRRFHTVVEESLLNARSDSSLSEGATTSPSETSSEGENAGKE